MAPPLKWLMIVTDWLFILYWSVAALAQAKLVNIPPELMYADYSLPQVISWNWSFFPLDIAFSVLGLCAVSAARRGNPVWRPLAIISLTLTMTAGGMAVSYWVVLLEFDPAWFLPNLALLVWPLFFLPQLIRH